MASEPVYRKRIALEAVRDGLIWLRGDRWYAEQHAPDDLHAMTRVPWPRNTFTALSQQGLLTLTTRGGIHDVALSQLGEAELRITATPHSTRLWRARRAA